MADFNHGYRRAKEMEAEMNGMARGGKVKHTPKPPVKISVRPAMPMPGPTMPPAGLGAVAPPPMPGMAKGGKVAAVKAKFPKPVAPVGVALNPVVKVKAHTRKFAKGGAVHADAKQDAAMMKSKIKPGCMKASGGKVKSGKGK